MKKKFTPILSILVTLSVLLFILVQVSCMNSETSEKKAPTHDEMVARGKYLVIGGSCADCHSPKIFTAMGPEPDTTKSLSGHPEGSPLPPMDTNALHPGYWILGAPDLTAWVGPFGMSYTANITPDSTTGIGAWSEENFINALHKGKHLGLDGGRPIMPPMPWNFIGKLTDDDLKSIFAYLKSLPPIKNQVPAPLSPDEVRAMAKGKPM